ncbi:MAG: acyl-CoA thioesterase [Phycisphaerales bacterium]|nr:acyl-CoA thioesterase [Phycisphaerales bacterium]
MSSPLQTHEQQSQRTDDGFAIETLQIPMALQVPVRGQFTLALSVGKSSLGATIAHVSNVEYVRWLDRIGELHGDVNGSSRAALLAQGRMWFVSRHIVDYLAESFEGDQLGCSTWISLAGRTTIQRETLIWNRHSGIATCRATSRWVYIDLTTRLPSRIPHSQLQWLQPLACRSESSR